MRTQNDPEAYAGGAVAAVTVHVRLMEPNIELALREGRGGSGEE
jgi:hypothetical protein